MAQVLINEHIVADEVRLNDENGEDRGLVATAAALALARGRGCDLVQDEIFSSPPRCRLVPTGGATGLAARAERIAAGGPPKDIRVSTTMGIHDVETRRRQAAGCTGQGLHGEADRAAGQGRARQPGQGARAARKLVPRPRRERPRGTQALRRIGSPLHAPRAAGLAV